MSGALNAADMLDRAQHSTGLSDFGDDSLPQRFATVVDLLNGIGMDAVVNLSGSVASP